MANGLEQLVAVAPSIEQTNVDPISPLIVSDAVEVLIDDAIPPRVGAPGATVSTLQVAFAAALVSPLVSVWVTERVWGPSAKSVLEKGLVQAAATPASRMQVNVDPLRPLSVAEIELLLEAITGSPPIVGASGTTPTAETGAEVRFVVPPSPSWPESLRPMQRTSLAKVTRHPANAPDASLETVPNAVAAPGALWAVVVESPSSP
jgi:hypothetical protein